MDQLCEQNCLNVPKSRPRENVGNLLFYLIGDKVFSLKTWLMRPYPGPMMINKAIKFYNYRHSQARCVIEDSFGVLCSRWQMFHYPIKAPIENVDRYTLACMTNKTFSVKLIMSITPLKSL